MAWQLIFKASDEDPEELALVLRPVPLARKPVSVTLQLDPGTMVGATVDEDEDDDD